MNGSNTVRLIVLIALAFGLRVGYCAARGTLGRSPERGYREYVVAGQRLLQHGTLVSPLIVADVDRRPSALMPPVYVGLVAGVYALFGVETFAATLVLHLINATATSLTVLIVFRVTSSLGGAPAGWIAAIIATINPTFIGYTDLIWDTSLFTLGVAISVWMALRMAAAPIRLTRWFALGLWFGALAVLNPALTVAYPVLVLWPLYRLKPLGFRALLRPVVVTVIGWLIALAPWTVRNYVQFEELMYVRSGFPIEMWLGVCPEADALGAPVFAAQFPLNNDEVQSHVASIGERAFIQECGVRARAAIAADGRRFVRLILVRIVDFWAGSALSHAAPETGGTAASLFRSGVMYFLLAETIVVVIALLILRGGSRDLRWLIAIMVWYSVIYCITHAQIRYRTPIEPVMAMVIGVMVLRAFARVTSRTHRQMP